MATDLNEVVLIGRLTKSVLDDERSFGYLPNGTAKAVLSLACNRGKKDGDKWTEEVSYFNVVVFGKTAENLKSYLLKGTQICVTGYLKQERWEKDGKKNSKIVIIGNTIQLLGRSDGTSTSSKSSFKQKSEVAPQQFDGDDYPEDIPF